MSAKRLLRTRRKSSRAAKSGTYSSRSITAMSFGAWASPRRRMTGTIGSIDGREETVDSRQFKVEGEGRDFKTVDSRQFTVEGEGRDSSQRSAVVPCK